MFKIMGKDTSCHLFRYSGINCVVDLLQIKRDFLFLFTAHIHHVIERLQLGENPRDVWFSACEFC